VRGRIVVLVQSLRLLFGTDVTCADEVVGAEEAELVVEEEVDDVDEAEKEALQDVTVVVSTAVVDFVMTGPGPRRRVVRAQPLQAV